jgi:hypothetical protein
MVDKVVFRAGVLNRRAYHLARGHFKVGNQRLRAMPFVFKLHQFHLTWLHRMIGMDPFPCLNACLFIRAHHMHTLGVQCFSLMIEFAHASHFPAE